MCAVEYVQYEFSYFPLERLSLSGMPRALTDDDQEVRGGDEDGLYSHLLGVH